MHVWIDLRDGLGTILGTKGSQMDAKTTLMDLEGSPEEAKRSPKGSPMDPTDPTHALDCCIHGTNGAPEHPMASKKAPKGS